MKPADAKRLREATAGAVSALQVALGALEVMVSALEAAATPDEVAGYEAAKAEARKAGRLVRGSGSVQ